jgi:hypothetical protein
MAILLQIMINERFRPLSFLNRVSNKCDLGGDLVLEVDVNKIY